MNGHITHKCGLRLAVNDEIRLLQPLPKETSPSTLPPIDFSVPIIYEDEDILIINKPSGLTSHRAKSEKEATLVDWLEDRGYQLSTISGEDRFGIVHRLDKPTSGIMVIAKNNKAHTHLSEQLKNRTMGRYYMALITPPLKHDITIDKPIGRHPNNRLIMSALQPKNAKSAKSYFKKLLTSHNEQYELIVAKLYSGRTHQIRVHLQTLNRHIIGDYQYGYKGDIRPHQQIFLHAFMIYLKHPNPKKEKEEINFTAHIDTHLYDFCQNHFDNDILQKRLEYFKQHADTYFADLYS